MNHRMEYTNRITPEDVLLKIDVTTDLHRGHLQDIHDRIDCVQKQINRLIRHVKKAGIKKATTGKPALIEAVIAPPVAMGTRSRKRV